MASPVHGDSIEATPESNSLGPKDRRTRRLQRAKELGPSDLLTIPFVLIAGCIVAWARAPWVFSHPQLWAEDGIVFFESAYEKGWRAPLFEPQAGYLQTFSRLVADIGLYVPLKEVPLLFAVVALVIQVLPAVLIASRRFAHAIPDFRVRLLIAAMYLVVPNSTEVNVDLTNSQWHLAILAVLVVLATPAGTIWRIFDVGAVVLSCLTGPYVLALIVVTVIVLYHRRQRWTMWLGVIALIAGALQMSELFTSVRQKVGPLGATVTRLAEILGGRLIGNTVFGTATTTSVGFYSKLLAYSVLMLIVAAAVIILAVWHGPFELKMFNLWAWLVLAGSLASPLAVIHGSQWNALVYAPGDRYWLFPELAFIVDVIWLAGQAWQPLRARQWAGRVGIVIFVLIVAFGVREDFSYPMISAPAWSAQVNQFLRLAPGTSYTFKTRPPGWTMTLTKKPVARK